MIEHDYIYQNIITSMYHTDRRRSEISCVILLNFLISCHYDINIEDTEHKEIRKIIMENISSYDKLTLFDLVTRNPQTSFSEFISWMYSEIDMPNMISSFLRYSREKSS